MKILITGATGFIGSHLIERLLKEKHKVYALVRPSTDKSKLSKKVSIYISDGSDNSIDNLKTFMISEKIDGIIHLASLFQAAHKPEDIQRLIQTNVQFGAEVLEAASLAKIPWFINTGTFWQHYKDKEYSPVNLYAASKQAFEVIAQYYTETTGLNFVTIKLNDTFGPFDTRSKVFALWSKISKSQEVLGMSPGEQIIDISYIDNVVDAYLQMITLISKDKNRKYNNKSFAVQSNKKMSLKKLAVLFEKVSGQKLNIDWGAREYRFREVMVPWSKGRKIPGWKQKVSLEEGIKKTLLK